MTDGPRSGHFFATAQGLGTIGDRVIVDRPQTLVKAMAWKIPHDDRPPDIQMRLEKHSRTSRSGPYGEACRISFQDDEAEKLFEFLSEVRGALGYNETTDYVVMQLDRNAPDAASVTRLLRYFSDDPRLFLGVADSVESGELQALQQGTSLIRIQRAAKELERLVDADDLEITYQRWFESHPWVFGSEYVERVEWRAIGLDAQADVLYRTADGFNDVFEIKRPRPPVLVWDQSHRTWRPSSELAEAFGQALKYLDEMDEQQLILQTRHGVTAYRPRVRIVIGRSNQWDEAQHKVLRAINAHWHGIEVLTYDMVIARARTLIGHLLQSLRRD